MIELRPHQIESLNDEKRLRQNPNNRNIVTVLPTGAGKSLTLAEIARQDYVNHRRCIIFAHRDVLISQLSEALCKMSVPHTFICNLKTKRDITNRNLKKYGDSFYDETSPIIVSSNPTFAARVKAGKVPQALLDSIHRWIQDECHHATKQSETWGTCLTSLTQAIGNGFTATPMRADKLGLGSHVDGFFDAMSVTTNMWDLIKAGYLSPYKAFTPPTRVDRDKMKANSGGDFTEKSAVKETDRKEVTGDAVEHYLRVSPGERAITFCININHARHVADEFNKRGVPAAAISSKDSQERIDQVMEDFENGVILNLVNVDLLGEGYDSPGITTLIMLRPTQSYSLFKQQFGRVLRTAPGKTYGIILDHVGNIPYMMRTFGLENLHDDPEWTLDRGTKRAKNDDGTKIEPWIRCPNVECGFQYKHSDHGNTCPECGHTETKGEAEARVRELQKVDGELVELETDVIQHLLAERERIDQPVDQFAKTVRNLPTPARLSATNKHAKRLHAQTILRDAIQSWCAKTGRETGWSVPLVQNEFNKVFGVHILKVQLLGERQAMELYQQVRSKL